MNLAFLDTTVFTDLLLKHGDRKREAREALDTFDETEVPVYAIKELKAGPLQHYVYLNNKLRRTESVSKTLEALNTLHPRYHARKKSTALEALAAAANTIGQENISQLADRYGSEGV